MINLVISRTIDWDDERDQVYANWQFANFDDTFLLATLRRKSVSATS